VTDNRCGTALSLNDLLERAEHNRQVSRVSRAGWCSVFQEIVVSHNGIMTHDLIRGNPNLLVVPLLLANYALAYYMSAIDVVLSGQLPACYSLLRMCLESIIYAYTTMNKRELSMVWLRRDGTPEEQKRFKEKFQITHFIDALPDSGAAPREALRRLYNRVISYGGHPNQKGALSIARLEHGEERFGVGVMLLSEGPPLVAALNSTAEVGYGMVCLEDLMFNVHLAPGTLPDRIHAMAQDALRECGVSPENVSEEPESNV
jgi:hypothetical protein